MEGYDTLWGYCAADQWLTEFTPLHRTSWDSLFSLRNGFTAYDALAPENLDFIVSVAFAEFGTSARSGFRHLRKT